jgi:uncharacterized protein YciW
MNLGGLPDFNKMLGETPSPGDPSDIEKLKKEVQWMKWAIIILAAYILFIQNKND